LTLKTFKKLKFKHFAFLIHFDLRKGGSEMFLWLRVILHYRNKNLDNIKKNWTIFKPNKLDLQFIGIFLPKILQNFESYTSCIMSPTRYLFIN
jgi:hypothetical protein